MQVEFELTEDDWIALFRDLASEKSMGRASCIRQLFNAALFGGMAILMIVFLTWGYLREPTGGELYPAFLAMAFLSGLFAAACLLLGIQARTVSNSGVRRQMRQTSGTGTGFDPLGPRTVSIGQTRIAESAAGYSRSAAWARIAEIRESTEYLFVYAMLLPQLIVPIIVPRRAFETEFAFAEFCGNAERLWQAAHADSRETVDDGS